MPRDENAESEHQAREENDLPHDLPPTATGARASSLWPRSGRLRQPPVLSSAPMGEIGRDPHLGAAIYARVAHRTTAGEADSSERLAMFWQRHGGSLPRGAPRLVPRAGPNVPIEVEGVVYPRTSLTRARAYARGVVAGGREEGSTSRDPPRVENPRTTGSRNIAKCGHSLANALDRLALET